MEPNVGLFFVGDFMGYIGNDGDHASQAEMDHVDNLIDMSRQYFTGVVYTECEDCDEPIPEARRKALASKGCTRCISCQEKHDKKPKPKIRILDHVL